MANHIVDFVMAVVRDPAVAAAYAADPAGTLADAHLVDVSPADVDTLIPMLTDSVAPAPFTAATSPPEAGTGEVGTREVGAGGDVWASGAATAAFDSFGPVDTAHAAVDASTGSGVGGWPAVRDVTTFFGGGAPDSPTVSVGQIDGAGTRDVGAAMADGHDAVSGFDAATGLGAASGVGGDAFLDRAHTLTDHATDHPSDPGGFDLF